MSLNKTKIEWTDYTWNPVTGCYGPGGTKDHRKHCIAPGAKKPYCYALDIAIRFEGGPAWPNGFEPTFHPERLNDLDVTRTASNQDGTFNSTLDGKRIFVCSMADLMGDWVPEEWIRYILYIPKFYPGITFYFLTKNPKRYAEFEFPENCWLGTTVESEAAATPAKPCYRDHQAVANVTSAIQFCSVCGAEIGHLYDVRLAREIDDTPDCQRLSIIVDDDGRNLLSCSKSMSPETYRYIQDANRGMCARCKGKEPAAPAPTARPQDGE